MSRLLACATVLLVLTMHGTAQEETETPTEDPSLKTREAIAHSVHYLLACTDKHLHNLVVQPGIVPTYEMVDRTYRRETYTAKIPVYEYTTVEVVKPVGSGSNRRMVKTTERRISGVKEYKEEERTRLISDPNGDVTRKVRRAVYATQDLDKGIGIPHGLMGYNAKAMHTLLMLGVPSDTPELRRLKGTLETYILNYGIPDATFDVAWLTAAFFRWPESSDEINLIRVALLRKLLGGQLNDAATKGMWGTVCIDYEVAAATMKHQLALYGDLAELKKALALATQKGRDREVNKIQGDISEAENAIEDDMAAAKRVSWVAEYLLGDYRKQQVLQPPHEDGGRSPDFFDTVYPLRTAGPMVDLLAENVTDLECTMWALFALAEVDAVDMLPARVDRPPVGRERFSPLESRAAIQRSFDAVVAAYDGRKKGWAMGIQYVDVRKKYFSAYEHVRERQAPKLEDPVTPMADAAAYQCLISLDRLGDLEDYSRHADKMVEAMEGRIGEAATMLTENLKNLGKLTPGSRNANTYLEALSGYHWRLGGLELVRPEIYETLGDHAMKTQHADGYWGNGKSQTIMDTAGLRALIQARWEARMAALPENKRQKRNTRSYTVAIHGAEVPTLDRLSYLADGVWPAVAAHWQADGLVDRPATLGRALQRVNRQGSKLSYVSASTWPPPGMADTPAVVMLSGTQALTDTQAKGLEPLYPFVRAGGVLVVEAPASEAGTAFARSLMSALTPALPELTFGDAPDDTYLLAALEKRPPVKAFMREDGSVAVVFVMLSDKTSGYELKPSAAAVIVATVIKARLMPLLLDRQFPILDENGLAFDFTPEPADDTETDTGEE